MAGLGRGVKIDLTGKRFNFLLVIKRGKPKTAKQTNHIYETWECLCDCGNQILITGKQLKRGQKSCGCHKLDGQFRKMSSDEDINIKKLINSYKTKKKKYTLTWTLSFEEAKSLFLAPCFYCGALPEREVQAYSNVIPSKVNGIDRIDSSQGYHTNNVVPCCMICNRAKMDMPQNAFLQYLNKLTTYRSNNESSLYI